MKIKFNDGTEMQVQSAVIVEDTLQVKTISATLQELREKFADTFACKKMEVIEREQVVATYEDYSELYRLEEYGAGIKGVVMYKKEKTPEVQNEMMAAAVIVARANAQFLPDQKALEVKILYDTWGDLVKTGFVAEKAGFKFTHDDALYKTIHEYQAFQGNWVPGQGTESMFTRIDEIHSGTKADPIPYVVNMEVSADKYYTEDGMLYKCIRDSGQPLQNKACELLSIYFELVG